MKNSKLGMRFKRFHLKASSFAVYAGVLLVLVVLAMSGYKPSNAGAENKTTEIAAIKSTAPASAVIPVTTLDDVKSANLAVNVATSANLSVADSVYSQSISVSAGADIGQYNATVANKTQATNLITTSVLTAYLAVEGDTASSIAAKFGISAQTIRWANNLTGDAVAVGSTVVVPALDGVVYTAKAGDNLKNVATRYKSNIDSIITVNDLDGATVAADTKLLLPDGILPENERPGYRAPTTPPRGTGTILFVPTSSGNRYSYGYCTWYAYNRRAELGRSVPSNLGNANTWAVRAAAAGYLVNRTPAVGAIMQNGGGLGHVAVVEAIYPNGSIMVSEMNAHYGVDFDGHQSGWGRISHRVVNNPGDYNFIH